MDNLGNKKWVIPGGYISSKSTGREPEWVSQDKVSVLNLNNEPVSVKMTIYYEDDEPIEGYSIEVKGERVRKFRVNDLINPFPVILEKAYSLVLEADKPVIVQFLKMDTGHTKLAMTGSMAYALGE